MNSTNDFWLIDSNFVGVMRFYKDRDYSDKSIDYMFIEEGIIMGIHGGLVGIWFLLNNGLIEFKENTPSFLAGPFTQNIPNPIGSFSAILILLLLCIFYTVQSKKIFTRRIN